MKKRIIAFILMLTCLSTLMFQKADIAQVDAANNSYNQLIGRGRCNWGRVDQDENNLRVASLPRIPSDKAQTKSDKYNNYFDIYCYYTDLNEKHWAYRYICLAKYFGIMSGVGNNQFGGEDVYIQACYYLRALCNVNNASCTRNHYYYNSTGYISRFDAIYAIWNNANRPYGNYEVSSSYNSYLYNYIYRFPELNNSKYYTWRNGRKCLNSYGKAITWSLYTGILSGSDGELLLDDYLTRAQTAKVLVDYFLYRNKETYAKTETYNWHYYINFNANGGYSYISTREYELECYNNKYVYDYINLDKSFVSRSGYTLKGWNLYRPVDDTWYVDGKGWFSEDTISAKNYTKATFSPTTSIKFDSRFLTNINDKTTVTSFTFYAVWEKIPQKSFRVSAQSGGYYLRVEPKDSASHICIVPTGAAVSTLQDCNGWAYAKYYNGYYWEYGYIRWKYLFCGTAAYRVTANGGLNLRSGPSTYYSYITTMPQGSTIVVDETTYTNGWYKVKYSTYEGWCSADYLSRRTDL